MRARIYFLKPSIPNDAPTRVRGSSKRVRNGLDSFRVKRRAADPNSGFGRCGVARRVDDEERMGNASRGIFFASVRAGARRETRDGRRGVGLRLGACFFQVSLREAQS